jgi:hypothetical protein
MRLMLFLLVPVLLTPTALAHGGSFTGPNGRGPRLGFGGPACGPPPRAAIIQKPNPEIEWDQWWYTNGGAHVRDRVAQLRPAAADDARVEALPVLLWAFKDDFFDTRAAAAIAVGKLITPSHPLYPVIVVELRELWRDSDKVVRESAVLAMGLIDDKSQVPDLLLIMRDDPRGRDLVSVRGNKPILPRTRAFAALAIGMIGSRERLDDAVVAELSAMAGGRAAESRPTTR